MGHLNFKNLTAKVQQILEDGFPDATVELEKFPGPKVGGTLVWKGFLGKEQIKRQQKLWKLLRRELTEEELLKVTFIFTATPWEVTVPADE